MGLWGVHVVGFLILGINVEKIVPWMDQSIIFRMVGKLKFLHVLCTLLEKATNGPGCNSIGFNVKFGRNSAKFSQETLNKCGKTLELGLAPRSPQSNGVGIGETSRFYYMLRTRSDFYSPKPPTKAWKGNLDWANQCRKN